MCMVIVCHPVCDVINFEIYLSFPEGAAQRCSVKNVFLEISQNSQKKTCARVSLFNKVQASSCNFIKKETLAQVLSCQFCKISKNTFSYRTLPVTASSFLIKPLFYLTENSEQKSKYLKNENNFQS